MGFSLKRMLKVPSSWDSFKKGTLAPIIREGATVAGALVGGPAGAAAARAAGDLAARAAAGDNLRKEKGLGLVKRAAGQATIGAVAGGAMSAGRGALAAAKGAGGKVAAAKAAGSSLAGSAKAGAGTAWRGAKAAGSAAATVGRGAAAIAPTVQTIAPLIGTGLTLAQGLKSGKRADNALGRSDDLTAIQAEIARGRAAGAEPLNAMAVEQLMAKLQRGPRRRTSAAAINNPFTPMLLPPGGM